MYLMASLGILRKLLGIIQREFQVVPGVKQDCILSPLLFLQDFDWIMQTNNKSGRVFV